MKKLIATLVLATTAPAYAGACTVISEAGDFPLPTFDIDTVAMTTDGDVIRMEMTFGQTPLANPNAFYNLYITPVATGGGWYLRANNTTPALIEYTYGTFTEDADGTRSRELAGDASGSIDGNVVTVEVPKSDVAALTGQVMLEAWAGAATTAIATVFSGGGTALDTTDPAPYTIGDSCAKDDELKAGVESSLGSDGRYFSAGAGSLGLLGLVFGLLGLRRRAQ